VGGVADYTAILSRRLVEVSDGTVEPVLMHAGNQPAEAIDVPFPVEDLSGQCSATALAQAIERLAAEADGRAVVLLEYSGYGYSANGAPRWLVNGLHRVCGKGSLPLITIFHELYASEYRPWKRNFWTAPFQHYVTRRLAGLSAGLVSNRDDTAQWLRRRVDGTPVRMCPSFSNVGEPDRLPSYEERAAYAVHFGGAEKKTQLYREWGPALKRILQRANVERIVDIGPTVPAGSLSEVSLPVEGKGILSIEEVSAYLQNASLGLLNYPLHCLKKSGIWASYAAHGVPTLLSAEKMKVDELRVGEHFLLLDETTSIPETAQLAEISVAAHRWYREAAHSEQTARQIAALISD
jgi:hypothetical protein